MHPNNCSSNNYLENHRIEETACNFKHYYGTQCQFRDPISHVTEIETLYPRFCLTLRTIEQLTIKKIEILHFFPYIGEILSNVRYFCAIEFSINYNKKNGIIVENKRIAIRSKV